MNRETAKFCILGSEGISFTNKWWTDVFREFAVVVWAETLQMSLMTPRVPESMTSLSHLFRIKSGSLAMDLISFKVHFSSTCLTNLGISRLSVMLFTATCVSCLMQTEDFRLSNPRSLFLPSLYFPSFQASWLSQLQLHNELNLQNALTRIYCNWLL